jgi:predicted dehydrogenase
MNDRSERTQSTRREIMKTAALAGAAVTGLSMSAGAEPVKTAPAGAPDIKPRDRIRVGFVGVGGQGGGHVHNLLKIEGVELRAVCDIRPERTEWAQKQVEAAGQPKPAAYNKGPEDFRRLCEQEDLDLVYTATPWEWHVPVCVAAMKAGKHAATEVPAAMTVDDCWQLVETAEKTRKHCQIMENCCYDRSELMVLNMIRKGLFGEVLHGECGYMHDLRGIKFDGGEGLWRRAWAMKHNANLYPTHGLGPMAWYMNINRGDRLDYLVSISSPSRGVQAYAAEHLPADDPRRKETYVLGDVNSSLLKTVNGLTILLQHDTNLPRPYSRLNLVHGTKGIFRGFPDEIYIEGRSKDDAWESADKYREEFDHPLWKAMNDRSKGAGHGGMDFIEDYRLIRALQKGIAPDIDVYDAAAWSAVVELTERSVANRSRPMDFPDFTRGRWKTAPPVELTES